MCKKCSLKLMIVFMSFLLIVPDVLFSKNVLVEGYSRVKQTEYIVASGKIIFTEKVQNINGDISEDWNINNEKVSKDEYNKKIALAEREELEIKKQEELKRQQLLEQKRKELQAKKEEDERLFKSRLKIQTLKRLLSLEIEVIENAFNKLDSYSISDYYVFEKNTFYSLRELEKVRYSLLSKAKMVSIKDINESDDIEIRGILTELEQLPDRINSFFRKSVDFAINKITDTKKLKELLALI